VFVMDWNRDNVVVIVIGRLAGISGNFYLDSKLGQNLSPLYEASRPARKTSQSEGEG
jgi:hypothetical protein